MANELLRKGARFLASYFRGQESVTVTYKRGALSVEILAAPGRTNSRVDRRLGLKNTIEQRDYIIEASDLMLAGNRILPTPGDLILETDAGGGKVRTYEVNPPLLPQEDGCFRYDDLYFFTMRVHTKLKATADV